MPRRRRYWIRNGCYHLTHRCHERKFLFRFAKYCANDQISDQAAPLVYETFGKTNSDMMCNTGKSSRSNPAAAQLLMRDSREVVNFQKSGML